MLIGSQQGESITATEWAELLGTIGYEVVYISAHRRRTSV